MRSPRSSPTPGASRPSIPPLPGWSTSRGSRRPSPADIETAGGSVVTGCEVVRPRSSRREHHRRHRRGATEAGFVISCAGAWSDRLAVAAGAPAEPRIVPFRGAYLRLRPERRELVRASIYPVPDPELPFLGGHLTRGIDEEVLLGPSALMVGARDAYRPREDPLERPPLEPRLARDLAARRPPLADRPHRASTRASRRAFIADAAALRPRARPGGCPPRPLGHPSPGTRPRRPPGRRLRRPPHRARPARAQRALACRDLVAGAGETDRRPGGELL